MTMVCHRLGQLIGLGQDVASFSEGRSLSLPKGREAELRPLLPGAGALEDVDIEISELRVVEIQVRRSVRVLVEEVRPGPVEHGHEVVADAVDALGGKVAEGLLVHLDLLVPVGAAVFDGLHHGKRFHDAPPHAVTFDVFPEVADFLARPHLSEGDVVQRGHDPFHADLPQHRERDLVFLTEPSPGFFHDNNAFYRFKSEQRYGISLLCQCGLRTFVTDVLANETIL